MVTLKNKKVVKLSSINVYLKKSKLLFSILFLFFFSTFSQGQNKTYESNEMFQIPSQLPENGIVERLISAELLAKYVEADAGYQKNVSPSNSKDMFVDKNKLVFINSLNQKHKIKDENLDLINAKLGTFLSPEQKKLKMIENENQAKTKENEAPKSVDAVMEEK